MEIFILIISLVILFISITESAKVLIIPTNGKSHMRSTNMVGIALKERGHQVYTVSGDDFASHHKQIGAEQLNVLHYKVPEGEMTSESKEVQEKLMDVIFNESMSFTFLNVVLQRSCINMYSDSQFMKQVSDLHFDFAVVEGPPTFPCNYLLAHINKIPYATFNVGLFPAITGTPLLPSYAPNLLMVPEKYPMSFLERIKSFIFHIVTSRLGFKTVMPLVGIASYINDLTMVEDFRQKGLVSSDIQEWFDFIHKSELFIVANSGFAMFPAIPQFANVIQVEGITATEAKPLDPEIKKIVEDAKDGVIIVSFGSNVKQMPQHIMKKLLNIFRKRKELFLMRYSTDTNEDLDLPHNVKFMKWLPQNDLIAHPNTKLFITHGGANGMYEALYQGIPMLAVPLFGDQPSNAQRLKQRGYGLYFTITDFTEQEVLEKIEKIITDPSFRERTQHISKMLHHQPMGPRETAAFWIEHVIKYGSSHLTTTSTALYWWQYYCLDVIMTLVTIVAVIIYIIFKAIKFVFKYICSNQRKVKKA